MCERVVGFVLDGAVVTSVKASLSRAKYTLNPVNSTPPVLTGAFQLKLISEELRFTSVNVVGASGNKAVWIGTEAGERADWPSAFSERTLNK